MTKEMNKLTLVIEKPTLSKAMFLDFETEREEWNKYLLEDETLLRAKLILTSVQIDKNIKEIAKEAKSGKKLQIGFGIVSHNLFAVEAPLGLRGSPDPKKYSPEELKVSIEKEELDFETKKETWNSYVFENGMRMKAKISPTSVNRTSKFNSVGMPVYWVELTIIAKLRLPEIIEKIRKKRKRVGKANKGVENPCEPTQAQQKTKKLVAHAKKK